MLKEDMVILTQTLDYNLQNEIEYCGFAESDWKEHNFKNNYEKINLLIFQMN